MQYSAIQYSAVQCSAVQYSIMQCSSVQCSTLQYMSWSVVPPPLPILWSWEVGREKSCLWCHCNCVTLYSGGVLQFDSLTLLRCYIVTVQCFSLTVLRCYCFTVLHCYSVSGRKAVSDAIVTVLQSTVECFSLTVLRCYGVTIVTVQCFSLTVLRCYCFTVLHCYSVSGRKAVSVVTVGPVMDAGKTGKASKGKWSEV